jgi:hypothetical protein
MSVLEPVAAPTARDTVVVEDLPATDVLEVTEVAVDAPPAYDHVTSHSMKCYWDVRECRWECSGA